MTKKIVIPLILIFITIGLSAQTALAQEVVDDSAPQKILPIFEVYGTVLMAQPIVGRRELPIRLTASGPFTSAWSITMNPYPGIDLISSHKEGGTITAMISTDIDLLPGTHVLSFNAGNGQGVVSGAIVPLNVAPTTPSEIYRAAQSISGDKVTQANSTLYTPQAILRHKATTVASAYNSYILALQQNGWNVYYRFISGNTALVRASKYIGTRLVNTDINLTKSASEPKARVTVATTF